MKYISRHFNPGSGSRSDIKHLNYSIYFFAITFCQISTDFLKVFKQIYVAQSYPVPDALKSRDQIK